MLKFVDYHAFDALCEHPVLCSKTEDWQEGLNHIEYAKMDLIIGTVKSEVLDSDERLVIL